MMMQGPPPLWDGSMNAQPRGFLDMPPGGGPTPPGSMMMPGSMNMGQGQMPMSTASVGMNPFGPQSMTMARP